MRWGSSWEPTEPEGQFLQSTDSRPSLPYPTAVPLGWMAADQQNACILNRASSKTPENTSRWLLAGWPAVIPRNEGYIGLLIAGHAHRVASSKNSRCLPPFLDAWAVTTAAEIRHKLESGLQLSLQDNPECLPSCVLHPGHTAAWRMYPALDNEG